MGMLEGKVAIVTGAGRGIGRGEAIQLAQAGADVVVNDFDGQPGGGDDRPAQQVVDEIVAAGGSACANYDDVASWKGAEDLIAQAVDTYGRLDILVNNAGIVRDRMSFNLTEDDWDAVINVHLKGHFAPSHFAARHWRALAKAGEPTPGRIINTSSEAGLFGNPGQANYSAAKAGIAAMSCVLARELEVYGITVNAIAPRARTRMTLEAFGEFGDADEGAFDAMHPDNVAPLVVWLASDEAAHVSGQMFVIWADEVCLVESWRVTAVINAGQRRWRPEELSEATKELFAKHDPGVPPFGVLVDLG